MTPCPFVVHDRTNGVIWRCQMEAGHDGTEHWCDDEPIENGDPK